MRRRRGRSRNGRVLKPPVPVRPGPARFQGNQETARRRSTGMVRKGGAVARILVLVMTLCLVWSAVALAQQPRIAFIPKNLGNPFFDAVYKGIQEAAAELGYATVYIGPPTADPASQIRCMPHQVTRALTASIIWANDASPVAPGRRAAMRRGTMVIAVDGDAALDARQAYIQPVDFNTIGAEKVRLMAPLINYEGEIT